MSSSHRTCLVQGFAVAGEISGASSMRLEHAPFRRRGFFASFTLQGVQAGQIMAAAVFLPLAHYMPTEQFNSWGFGYLYALGIHNVALAVAMSLLMWGVVYQGYNAIFPSFFPELFPTRTRVWAMAISQNIGTAITAMLPALFATLAPPGSANIWLTVGALAFGITVIAAAAAWSARETCRIAMDDLGRPDTQPLPQAECERLRRQAMR